MNDRKSETPDQPVELSEAEAGEAIGGKAAFPARPKPGVKGGDPCDGSE